MCVCACVCACMCVCMHVCVCVCVCLRLSAEIKGVIFLQQYSLCMSSLQCLCVHTVSNYIFAWHNFCPSVILFRSACLSICSCIMPLNLMHPELTSAACATAKSDSGSKRPSLPLSLWYIWRRIKLSFSPATGCKTQQRTPQIKDRCPIPSG